MKKLRLGWNPIIVKELRSQMRGARAFIILTAFLLLLGLVSYGLYRIMAATSGSYGGSPLLSAHVGQAIFAALALFELLLVSFITPALTAGVISGERERLTYDMLLATPLRPHSILWGKFVSALVYVLLLIFAAVPMASLVFIFGGVAPQDLVGVLIVLLTTAVTFGAVGLFFSALLGRTARATVISYAVIIALIVTPTFIYMAWGIIRQQEPPRAFLYLSPYAAMLSALHLTTFEPGPAWNGPQALILMPFMLPFAFLGFDPPGPRLNGLQLRPIWHYTVGLYIGLTLLCYLLSTQLVKPTRRWKIGWKGVLLLALILLLYGGAAYAVYGQDGMAAWTAPPTPEPLPLVSTPTPVSPPPTLAPLLAPTPLPELSWHYGVSECEDMAEEELGVEVAVESCGQIEAALETERNTLRVVETHVGKECHCLCGRAVQAEITGLSAGEYRVEVVWQGEDGRELLGEGEVVINEQ